jgi:hypothetical protein
MAVPTVNASAARSMDRFGPALGFNVERTICHQSRASEFRSSDRVARSCGAKVGGKPNTSRYARVRLAQRHDRPEDNQRSYEGPRPQEGRFLVTRASQGHRSYGRQGWQRET